MKIDFVAIAGYVAIVSGVGILYGYGLALIVGGAIALACSLLGAILNRIATRRDES